MKILLTLSLLVLLGASASAQPRSIVVTTTPDGLVTTSPGDARVGDASAVLLTQTGNDGWHLRVLSADDVPSQVASRVPADGPDGARLRRQAVRLREQSVRLRETVGRMGTDDGAAGEVSYRVRGTVADGSPALLIRLSEADALDSFSVSGSGSEQQVEATFLFASVAEWAAWKVQPATTALLDRLLAADRQVALSVGR